MRIETLPYSRIEIEPSVFITRNMKHEPIQVLTARKELFKCPKCIGGVVKEEVDDFQLVLRCVNCGWEKCSLEPEEKKIKGEGIYGNNYKRY